MSLNLSSNLSDNLSSGILDALNQEELYRYIFHKSPVRLPLCKFRCADDLSIFAIVSRTRERAQNVRLRCLPAMERVVVNEPGIPPRCFRAQKRQKRTRTREVWDRSSLYRNTDTPAFSILPVGRIFLHN